MDRMSRSLAALAVAALLVLVALPAAAVEPVAQSTGECLPGELCIPNEGNIDTRPGGSNVVVKDPPGNYVRSLGTLGAIGLVLAAYFYVAFGGKRLPFRRRPARA